MRYLYNVNIPDEEMEDKITTQTILDNILFSVFKEFEDSLLELMKGRQQSLAIYTDYQTQDILYII